MAAPRTKISLIVGALFLLLPYGLRAVQLLGDLDTACVIADLPPDKCGSGAVIEFILTPPVWMVTLSVAAALGLFAYVERQRTIAERAAERERERPSLEKLDKLHDDFWKLSAQFHGAQDIPNQLTAPEEFALEILWEQLERSAQNWPQAINFFVALAEIAPALEGGALVGRAVNPDGKPAAQEFWRGYMNGKYPPVADVVHKLKQTLPSVRWEGPEMPEQAFMAMLYDQFDEDDQKVEIASLYWQQAEWLRHTFIPEMTRQIGEAIGAPYPGDGGKYQWLETMRVKVRALTEQRLSQSGTGRGTPR